MPKIFTHLRYSVLIKISINQSVVHIMPKMLTILCLALAAGLMYRRKEASGLNVCVIAAALSNRDS